MSIYMYYTLKPNAKLTVIYSISFTFVPYTGFYHVVMLSVQSMFNYVCFLIYLYMSSLFSQ